MITYHEISQRQACKAVSLPRSTQCYKQKPKADAVVIEQLQQLVENIRLLVFGRVITASEEKDLHGIIKKYTEYTLI